MSSSKKALLLIGSPKGLKSTSNSLGSYLLEQLENRGFDTKTLTVDKLSAAGTQQELLLAELNMSNLIILASPLYVDSLPAPVIKVMQTIKAGRQKMQDKHCPYFMAIINSGFPESHQSDTAMAITRRFAKEAKLEWLGGLALGGGGSIAGRPLKSLGGMTKRVMKSLDITALAVADGKTIPPEVLELMSKPLVSGWLYTLIGGYMMKRAARKHGVKNINSQPFKCKH